MEKRGSNPHRSALDGERSRPAGKAQGIAHDILDSAADQLAAAHHPALPVPMAGAGDETDGDAFSALHSGIIDHDARDFGNEEIFAGGGDAMSSLDKASNSPTISSSLSGFAPDPLQD